MERDPVIVERSERPSHRRAVLHVAFEQIAALLHLPDDVDIVAFQLDHIRDSVSLLLQGDRFEPVPQACEPRSLIAELFADIADDGAVTRRVTWPELDGVGISTRTEGMPNGPA